MATWNVATIGALQAVHPSKGDDAIVAGYFNAGDLGGGVFYWEGPSALPASATITGVTAVGVSITALTASAPVQATSASTNMFWTGQVIVITGKSSTFTGVAPGKYTITVPDPLKPYIFTLDETSGSGAYASGSFTANTATITTSAAHGLISGQHVMIGNVEGATAVNGTWKATMITVSGLPSATQFSIGVQATGKYTAKTGTIGDGGTTIPENQKSSPTNSRWRRIYSEGLSVKWFGAGIGAGDAAAMLAAANAATSGVLSVTITAGGSGYVSVSVHFSAPQGLNGITSEGTANVTGGVVTSVTITAAGSGYTSPPTLTFFGGSGASAIANMPSSSSLRFPPHSYGIPASLAFPSWLSVEFPDGAVLAPAAGALVTINGPIVANPTQQIFGGAGVIALTSAANDRYFPNWWGACGDGVTDDTAALLACFAALRSAPDSALIWHGGGTIYFPPGTYLCSQELAIPERVPVTIEGAGMASSIIRFQNIGNGLVQRFPVGENFISYVTIRDLALTNYATLSIGISNYAFKSAFMWQPGQTHVKGDVVCPAGASNRLLQCISPGTTGSYPPFGKLWGGVPAVTTTPAAPSTFPAATIITVKFTAGFPSSGTLVWFPPSSLTPEIITYTGMTSTTFTGCSDANSFTVSPGDELTSAALYPYITGTPTRPIQQISVEIYDGGFPGVGGMTFKWSEDNKLPWSGKVPTASGPGAYALGSTGLSVNFVDGNYVGSQHFNSPPMGAGFSVIVGDQITDGTLTWQVIDGGVGILFEDGGGIQIERCNIQGFIVGIVNDGNDCMQIRDCLIGNVNGVWAVSSNERRNQPYACTTIAAGSVAGTLNVVSTAGFPFNGEIEIPCTLTAAGQVIAYTGKTATSFMGCSPVAGALTTGWFVQRGRVIDSGATNVHCVTGGTINHNEIGIIDSGGADHTYRDVNFEAPDARGALNPPSNNVFNAWSWYVWATYVVSLQVSGITAEGANGGIFLGYIYPFTGARFGGASLGIRIEHSEWTVPGTQAGIEFWAGGFGAYNIDVERCYFGWNSVTIPFVNNVDWCSGARFRDNYYANFKGSAGIFGEISHLPGIFVYEQCDNQLGVVLDPPNGPAACGIGINCIPAVNGYDLNCPLALRSRPVALSSGSNDNVKNPGSANIEISAPGAFTITGIAGGTEGQILRLTNLSGYSMTFAHKSTSSAGNQIWCPSGGSTAYPPPSGGFNSVQLVYSSSQGYWLLLGGV